MSPRHREDRGAVLVLTAIALPVLLLMTAFSLDLGRQRAARRDMQAKADVIALDLARLIDGSPANAINYSAALAASTSRNNLPLAKVTSVRFGTLDASTKKFLACVSCVPTSVKVTAEDEINYFFQQGTGRVSRSAVASQDAVAGFSIGSFAAAVNAGSSPFLNALIGNALNLGVLSYTGLASTQMNYLGIANELGLATPGELFTGNVTAYQALAAQAAILQRQNPNSAEVQVLNQVLSAQNSTLSNVTVGQIARAETGGENAAVGSTVNLFDFLATGAFIANGNQSLAIPTTVLNLPGVTFQGALSLIQGPQTVFGHVGTQASVSQAGLAGTFNMGNTAGTCTPKADIVSSLVGLVPNILNLLLGGQSCGLLGLDRVVTIEVQAQLSVNAASATGTISRIACTNSNKQLDIGVLSGLVTESLNFSAVVKSGALTLATVPLSVTNGSGTSSSSALFTIPPDSYNVYKATNPGSGSLSLNNAQLTGGAALGTLLTAGVTVLLDNATNAVNTQLLTPLTKALGVRVAGADVAARSIDCTAVKLAG